MNKFLSNFYLSTNNYTTEVNKNESSSGDLKVRKTSKTKYKMIVQFPFIEEKAL